MDVLSKVKVTLFKCCNYIEKNVVFTNHIDYFGQYYSLTRSAGSLFGQKVRDTLVKTKIIISSAIIPYMKISYYPIYMKISLPESTSNDHFQASIQKFCIA